MTRSELEKQAERSKAIDRALDAEGEKLRRECKVLVLGGPESGAETLMKQLEIFKNGYSTEELLLYRDGVRRMALKAMQAAMEHLRETGIELDNEDMNYAEIILKEIGKSQESVTEITLAAANVMKSLWDSPRSRSFFYETVANDSTYLFEEIQRIARPDYIPTEEPRIEARGFKSTSLRWASSIYACSIAGNSGLGGRN